MTQYWLAGACPWSSPVLAHGRGVFSIQQPRRNARYVADERAANQHRRVRNNAPFPFYPRPSVPSAVQLPIPFLLCDSAPLRLCVRYLSNHGVTKRTEKSGSTLSRPLYDRPGGDLLKDRRSRSTFLFGSFSFVSNGEIVDNSQVLPSADGLLAGRCEKIEWEAETCHPLGRMKPVPKVCPASRSTVSR